MKVTTILWVIITTGLLGGASAFEANQLVARDSNGMVIEIKEKYGGTIIDTATAVMFYQGNFVVIHREGVAAWYPVSFHSVRVLERLAPSSEYALRRPGRTPVLTEMDKPQKVRPN